MAELQRIGSLCEDDFYLQKLLNLRQTSTVNLYQRYFEMLKDLVLGKYSDLDEAYFVSQCINGLKEDIKKVVQLFQPSTVEHVLSLATFQESIVANKARTIASIASSVFNSSLSTESMDKHASDQMSVISSIDRPVIANSSYTLNDCTNDFDVLKSEIQKKSYEGQMPFEGIVVTVDAEKLKSGTVQNVKCDSLAGLASQYRWPLTNSSNHSHNIMASPVQQIWSGQTFGVNVDQPVQDDDNVCLLSTTTLFQEEYDCCLHAIRHTTFIWEPGPWFVISEKENHVGRDLGVETTKKVFTHTMQYVMLHDLPLSHRKEYISSILSWKKGYHGHSYGLLIVKSIRLDGVWFEKVMYTSSLFNVALRISLRVSNVTDLMAIQFKDQILECDNLELVATYSLNLSRSTRLYQWQQRKVKRLKNDIRRASPSEWVRVFLIILLYLADFQSGSFGQPCMVFTCMGVLKDRLLKVSVVLLFMQAIKVSISIWLLGLAGDSTRLVQPSVTSSKTSPHPVQMQSWSHMAPVENLQVTYKAWKTPRVVVAVHKDAGRGLFSGLPLVVIPWLVGEMWQQQRYKTQIRRLPDIVFSCTLDHVTHIIEQSVPQYYCVTYNGTAWLVDLAIYSVHLSYYGRLHDYKFFMQWVFYVSHNATLQVIATLTATLRALIFVTVKKGAFQDSKPFQTSASSPLLKVGLAAKVSSIICLARSYFGNQWSRSEVLLDAIHHTSAQSLVILVLQGMCKDIKESLHHLYWHGLPHILVVFIGTVGINLFALPNVRVQGFSVRIGSTSGCPCLGADLLMIASDDWVLPSRPYKALVTSPQLLQVWFQDYIDKYVTYIRQFRFHWEPGQGASQITHWITQSMVSCLLCVVSYLRYFDRINGTRTQLCRKLWATCNVTSLVTLWTAAVRDGELPTNGGRFQYVVLLMVKEVSVWHSCTPRCLSFWTDLLVCFDPGGVFCALLALALLLLLQRFWVQLVIGWDILLPLCTYKDMHAERGKLGVLLEGLVNYLMITVCFYSTNVVVKSVVVRGILSFDPGIDCGKLSKFRVVLWCTTFGKSELSLVDATKYQLDQHWKLLALFVLHANCPPYWHFYLLDELKEEFATMLTDALKIRHLQADPKFVGTFSFELVLGCGLPTTIVVHLSTVFEACGSVYCILCYDPGGIQQSEEICLLTYSWASLELIHIIEYLTLVYLVLPYNSMVLIEHLVRSMLDNLHIGGSESNGFKQMISYGERSKETITVIAQALLKSQLPVSSNSLFPLILAVVP